MSVTVKSHQLRHDLTGFRPGKYFIQIRP